VDGQPLPARRAFQGLMKRVGYGQAAIFTAVEEIFVKTAPSFKIEPF
jgi:hypothetical protein